MIFAVFTATGQDWRDVPGGRFAPVKFAANTRTGFVAVAAADSGVVFSNQVPLARHLTNQILLNGSGVAAGDVDGDGRCDLFFAGLGGGSRLYRNLGGWRFADITGESGLNLGKLDATGAVLADVDGDGDLDLLVSSYLAGTHILINDGHARFQPALRSPVNLRHAGGSLALADFDGDGWLDLYVANYRARTVRDEPGTRFSVKMIGGQPTVTSINGLPMTHPANTNRFLFRFQKKPDGSASILHDEQGEADRFYRNTGGGRFADVPFTGGTFLDEQGQPLAEPPFDWGLAVMFRDLNGDGWPDLYVCNDFTTPDRIWINDGHGHFRAIPSPAIRHTSLSSMGVDVADLNRDGHDDLFVLDMLSREHWRRLLQRTEVNPNMHLFRDVTTRPQIARNTLQLARGDGTYAEIAPLAGLEAAEWAWTPIFLDVDLDGYEDLLVSNGFERDNLNMDVLRRLSELRGGAPGATNVNQLALRREFPRLDTPNCAFRNQHDLTFADLSADWGFDQPGVSQGMCLADLDNDGDQDVVINNFNGPAFLLRNDSPAPRIAVRLKGNAPNTCGIGARLKLLGGTVPVQTQEMIAGGRYLSSDDPMRVFAAGSATNGMTLEVTWRNGGRTLITNVEPNRLYEVAEVAARPVREAPAAIPTPLFTDVSARLGHRSTETPFDDFSRQPLLPHKLSQLGPGVAWFDLDGDGREDLVVAGGNGAALAAFHNDGRGGFTRLAGPPFDRELTRDQTTVLGWNRGPGDTVLLAGSSNYEDGMPEGASVRLYDLGGKTVAEFLPGQPATTGPLAMADVNGDGLLDLFVGGRCLPGRWPEAVPSKLYRQAGGQFAPDDANNAVLANAGLVSGAVFSDLDGDGDPDLVLACEWGPLRVFKNNGGRLAPWDLPLRASPPLNSQLSSLNQLPGWWTGVNSGDFDGDGRLDLVAANWGRNTRYQRGRAQPLRLYFGDFNGDGGVSLIEAHYDPPLDKVVPWLDLDTLGRSQPYLRERFASFEAFGRAGLPEILGDRLALAKSLEANWLETTLFLNRGDHFEPVVLPLEAQMAPAFAVCIGDLDGDGREDVFLSQNFFANRRDLARDDAGRGLLLRGNGTGGLVAASGADSGLLIYGEQRGAALCDYDGDGRTDLVVTQNGGETKLFHNETARPGLRVRLQGPPGNLAAIGAVLRRKDGDRLGPARELHAGAGYWSQDAATQVLAGAGNTLWIRWPGGKETTVSLPPNAREVTVNASGQVTAAPAGE